MNKTDIMIGSMLWVVPDESDEQMEKDIRGMLDNGLIIARIFMNTNFSLWDRFFAACERLGMKLTVTLISLNVPRASKYMTTDDYVAYFTRCHDAFGAMSLENLAPAAKKAVETPKVVVNQKKVEQIKKIKAKEAAKARKQSAKGRARSAAAAQPSSRTNPAQRTAVNARPAQRPITTSTSQRATRPASENIKIESSKLDAFFTKLSAVKGRALASVAAFAICCTFAIGGIVALNDGGSAEASPAMERMHASDVVENTGDEAHANLLSTLE